MHSTLHTQHSPFPPLLAVNVHPFSCMADNLHPSWWSTSTPSPGGQPSPLLVVNIHTLLLAKNLHRGQLPPLLSVSLCHSWQVTSIQSTSTPPVGQPPAFLAINLYPSWRNKFPLPGSKNPSILAVKIPPSCW